MMSVIAEGDIKVLPDGQLCVTGFSVSGGDGMYELERLAEDRVLKAADLIRERRANQSRHTSISIGTDGSAAVSRPRQDRP